MNDSIEKHIELKAPVSPVWRALTDYREFGAWFRAELETPFVVGKVTRGRNTYPGYEILFLNSPCRRSNPSGSFPTLGILTPSTPKSITARSRRHWSSSGSNLKGTAQFSS